jgi:formate hydrogenlyase transcriptional activator
LRSPDAPLKISRYRTLTNIGDMHLKTGHAEGLDELEEARESEAATRKILRVIRQSRSTPQPVFDTIASAAMNLCCATVCNVFTYDGQLVHLAATTHTGPPGDEVTDVRRKFPRPPGTEMAGPRSVLKNDVIEIPDVVNDPEFKETAHALATGFRSILAVPMVHDSMPIGSIVVGRPAPGAFPPRHLTLLQTFAEQAVIAIENARHFNELQREIEAHRRSKATIAALVDETRSGIGALVGGSAALRVVREQIEKVAPTDSTVLIQGETGTGKELVARAVHGSSRRRDRPLIVVNCAALPRELVESELFGHEKGAFTGALQQRRGRFELADGGTLFLDEVGELPLEAQAKLLRVLQQGEFERVGGSRILAVDVRMIAATNRDLQTEVAAGRFRADLFYRLNVFPIALPALRDRRSDIAALARNFVAHIAPKLGRAAPDISPAFLEWASTYAWPGNIRELENIIERALITADTGAIDLAGIALAPARSQASEHDATLEAVEREHIGAVLNRRGWKVEGPTGAAKVLGLTPSTLRARMRKLGIRRPG